MKLSFNTAIAFLFILVGFQVAPVVVHAESIFLVDCKFGQDGKGNPKIIAKNPDGSVKGTYVECGFLDAIAQIKKLVNLAFIIALPIVVIALTMTGIRMLLAQGNASALNKAKELFQKTLIGFIVVLCAWLFVYTLTSYFLRPEFYNVFLGAPNSPEQLK